MQWTDTSGIHLHGSPIVFPSRSCNQGPSFIVLVCSPLPPSDNRGLRARFVPKYPFLDRQVPRSNRFAANTTDHTETRPKPCQGRYPTWITVFGYAMKKRRFEELHGKAIRWPEGKLEYIGIDGDQKRVMDEAKKGEVRCRTYA